MICPRCGREVSDTETLCPFCMQIIDHNVEFNDYRKDGFIQIQQKNEDDTTEAINYTPKYFDVSEFQIFIIAFVFILIVSAFTLFSLRFVQKTNPDYNKDYSPPTLVTAPPETTVPETEPVTVRNDVKKVTIQNLVGSWKFENDFESEDIAIPYISFTSDGISQENYGSITRTGVYRDVSTKKHKIVFISLGSSFKGRYIFKVTGNSKDGYTLTLKSVVNRNIYTLVSTTAKTSVLKPEKNPKLDKRLFGYWLSDEGKSYKFNKDGTLIRYADNTTTQAIWSVDEKDVITIKYRKEIVKTVDVEYYFSDEMVIINGTEYVRHRSQTEATAPIATEQSEE